MVAFLVCRAQALGAWASVVVAHGITSSVVWDLPGPGIEPVSPAWADGFSYTVPPGKSNKVTF